MIVGFKNFNKINKQTHLQLHFHVYLIMQKDMHLNMNVIQFVSLYLMDKYLILQIMYKN